MNPETVNAFFDRIGMAAQEVIPIYAQAEFVGAVIALVCICIAIGLALTLLWYGLQHKSEEVTTACVLIAIGVLLIIVCSASGSITALFAPEAAAIKELVNSIR